jgi:DNA polymerase-3 subunit delta'
LKQEFTEAAPRPAMSFADFPPTEHAIELLSRSLARQRLGHAYLFSGDDLDHLELVAGTLAQTVNCASPRENPRVPGAPDACGACLSCRKIAGRNHPDIQWVRPESKSRVITVDQMRDLMQTVYLKPTEATYKVAVIVSADRLHLSAANAFLKTLEEPPARSVMILLTTEPARLLETILSRCLRLAFPGGKRFQDATFLEWLGAFSGTAVAEQGSLLSRYRLLSVLLTRLNELKEKIGEELTARSPINKYDDLEPKLREKWEDELSAAIEAEYRRQRADLLTGLEFWLRDVWVRTRGQDGDLLTFPQFATAAGDVARRITPAEAMDNVRVIEQTQRLLGGNIQEALALEVGLLKLRF